MVALAAAIGIAEGIAGLYVSYYGSVAAGGAGEAVEVECRHGAHGVLLGLVS